MYYISRVTQIGNIDINEILKTNGFIIKGRNEGIKVNETYIKNLNIRNATLANTPVTKKVQSKYERLINNITDLLTDDDSDGEEARLALNEIEKFRLEIKIKYRQYLKKIELEKMSKQLKFLKKAAEEKLQELENYYQEEQKSGKSVK